MVHGIGGDGDCWPCWLAWSSCGLGVGSLFFHRLAFHPGVRSQPFRMRAATAVIASACLFFGARKALQHPWREKQKK